MKMLLLVTAVTFLLTACGVLSVLWGDRLPGDVAERHEVQTPLERTIADFTLGMAQEEALMLLDSGIQQHTLTVLPGVGMRPDRPESLQERWIAHVPPHAFSTKGFTDGEFIDRQSNNEIAKKFEVSVDFKSNTTKSVTLHFYQAKLFKIDIVPLEQYAVMYKVLQDKYGLPNTPLPRVDEWIDKTTMVRVLKPGLSMKEGIFFYIDRPLYTLLRREAAALKRALQDEEHRRKRTVPKPS